MRGIDPDSEENQAASRQNEREVFALQMQVRPTCSRCGQFIPADAITNRGICDDCEHEGRAEESAPKWEPDEP